VVLEFATNCEFSLDDIPELDRIQDGEFSLDDIPEDQFTDGGLSFDDQCVPESDSWPADDGWVDDCRDVWPTPWSPLAAASADSPAAPTSDSQVRPDLRYIWDALTDKWCDPIGIPLEIHTFFRGWSALRLLGVYGCRRIEDSVIAGLALGEPVLLIGAPGGAKTAMTERLASDMHMKFWAYDASKAMFEDIVGFPDPASLGRGEVSYVPTPLSLQGKQFVLIDEVSRAHPALQNKWLEIIRSRRVMGLDLPDLQTVFGAMNPAGLAGTVALDEALAGRFTFHITVPDINGMCDDDRRSVIEAGDVNPVDSDSPSSCLRWVVQAVRDASLEVVDAHGCNITTYVDALCKYLAGKDWKLDGRRQGMMRRGLVAYVATRGVFKGRIIYPTELGRVMRGGLDTLMPWSAMDREIPRVIMDGAHQYALGVMDGINRILPPSDVLTAANMVANGEGCADADQLSLLVTRVLQAMDRPKKPEDAVRAGAAMLRLVLDRRALTRLPVEARQRLMVVLSETLEVDADAVSDFIQEATNMPFNGLDGRFAEPVMRLSFNLKKRSKHRRGNNMEFEEMVALMSRYIVEGEAA
jgi:hypothetical protein